VDPSFLEVGQVLEAVGWVKPKVRFCHSAEKFRNSKKRWLVSVAMVSEGVDIPRLRIMAYRTILLRDLRPGIQGLVPLMAACFLNELDQAFEHGDDGWKFKISGFG
jgi:hypothetical protein